MNKRAVKLGPGPFEAFSIRCIELGGPDSILGRVWLFLCHSVRSLLSYPLGSTNVKIKILSRDRVTTDRVWIGNWIY
jgi:LSD1 subclass zinc finger protein